jgi:chaperonin GroES
VLILWFAIKPQLGPARYFAQKAQYAAHITQPVNGGIEMAKKADAAEATKLNLRPLADRVVIESVEEEESTFAGGKLVLPETAKEKPQKGVILAIGPGRLDDDGKRAQMDVKVGDQVLYAKYAGTEIKIEGRKLLILKESDILAVVESN